jgi:hypothetical protein
MGRHQIGTWNCDVKTLVAEWDVAGNNR